MTDKTPSYKSVRRKVVGMIILAMLLLGGSLLLPFVSSMQIGMQMIGYQLFLPKVVAVLCLVVALLILIKGPRILTAISLVILVLLINFSVLVLPGELRMEWREVIGAGHVNMSTGYFLTLAAESLLFLAGLFNFRIHPHEVKEDDRIIDGN